MLFYGYKSSTGAVFIKEAEFFEAQNGRTESWGSRWHPVLANSLEEARRLVEGTMIRGPWKRFPMNSRQNRPIAADPYGNSTNFLEEAGTDAVKWAKEWLRIYDQLPEEKIDEAWMIGWFANAIEAGRSAGYQEARKELLQQMVDKESMRQQAVPTNIVVGDPDAGLNEKVKAAVERYNSLSPKEKKAHDDAQQESWVRGEMAISAAERAEGRHTRVMAEADYSKLEERVIASMLNDPKNQDAIRGTVTGRFSAKGQPMEQTIPKRVAPRVPEGQTPLDHSLQHPLLDVIEAGRKARDDLTPSPYHGHSLEHCLHAAGWVYRDLRIELGKAKERIKEFEMRLTPEPLAVDRFAEMIDALKSWMGELDSVSRERCPDGTPRGKFETEELYRKAKAFIERSEGH